MVINPDVKLCSIVATGRYELSGMERGNQRDWEAVLIDLDPPDLRVC